MDEVAITCSSSDSIFVWQLRSGSVLQTFKNNIGSYFTRCNVKYILSPQENKPYLHAYTWNKDSIVWKAPLPEKLICVCSSLDGKLFCGCSSSGVTYLWDTYNGNLLSQWQSHFNEVLAVSFFGSSCEMIITSGKDSMIHCWLTSHVIQNTDPKPYKSWSGHSLPVTSLHCSNSRILSSSLDHTCKIWSLTSNEAISSIIFPNSISYSVINECETAIYAGSNDGKIYAVNLLQSDTHPLEQVFIGHSKSITSLSLSLDGTILLSTSLDNTVKLWDTSSFQLIRNITYHNGPVTSSNITLIPRCLFEDNIKYSHHEPFSMFKKYPTQGQHKIMVSASLTPKDIKQNISNNNQLIPVNNTGNAQEELQSLQNKVETLENQISRWNNVSKQLYKLNLDTMKT